MNNTDSNLGRELSLNFEAGIMLFIGIILDFEVETIRISFICHFLYSSDCITTRQTENVT